MKVSPGAGQRLRLAGAMQRLAPGLRRWGLRGEGGRTMQEHPGRAGHNGTQSRGATLRRPTEQGNPRPASASPTPPAQPERSPPLSLPPPLPSSGRRPALPDPAVPAPPPCPGPHPNQYNQPLPAARLAAGSRAQNALLQSAAREHRPPNAQKVCFFLKEREPPGRGRQVCPSPVPGAPGDRLPVSPSLFVVIHVFILHHLNLLGALEAVG